MTTIRVPGEIRLEREVVRMVSIPYTTAFPSGPVASTQNLASATIQGMKSDSIAKKRTVKLRLEGDGFGIWRCPRLSGGHSGTRIHINANKSSGYCTESYDQNPDGKCGRKLEVDETHWHEMAEAFGFLESQGDSYVLGKFGSVAGYLDGENWISSFENRARKGLYLSSLLENHGDFVIPFLWTVANPLGAHTDLNKRVLDVFRTNLNNRLKVFTGNNFPPSQAVLRIRRLLEKKIGEFEHYEGPNKPKDALVGKTQYEYAGRARAYLSSLSLVEDVAGKSGYRLTSDGERLVSSLNQQGIMVNETTCNLSPSFEAIHDVFSVTMDKYSSIFSPIIRHQTLEDIIMGTLMPETRRVPWKKYQSEITSILPNLISRVGNRLAIGAHIDTVRLALFLRQLGRGTPTILDNPEGEDDPNQNGIRDHAIIKIAGDDADTYVLGSARVGRRLWSVNLLRNPS